MSLALAIVATSLADKKDPSVRNYLNAVITLSDNGDRIFAGHLSSWDISRNSLKTRTSFKDCSNSYEAAHSLCEKHIKAKMNSKSGERVKVDSTAEVFDEGSFDEIFKPLADYLTSKRVTMADTMRLKNSLKRALDSYKADSGKDFIEKARSTISDLEDFSKVEEEIGIGVETRKMNENWGMF